VPKPPGRRSNLQAPGRGEKNSRNLQDQLERIVLKPQPGGRGGGGAGGPDRDTVPVTLVVAAQNSKQPSRADYRCTGNADQNTLRQALLALPAEQGGIVQLLEGLYRLSEPLLWDRNRAWLVGNGPATRLAGVDTLVSISADDAAVANLQLSMGGLEAAGVAGLACLGVRVESAPGDGFYLESVVDSDLRDCWVLSAEGCGVRIVGGSRRVRVGSCRVQNTGSDGIRVGGTY
jgi:hypothetical protein